MLGCMNMNVKSMTHLSELFGAWSLQHILYFCSQITTSKLCEMFECENITLTTRDDFAIKGKQNGMEINVTATLC